MDLPDGKAGAARTEAFELGRRHADLFLGFSCFLQEQAQREQLETLFFCTREGVFFKAVYDALFSKAPRKQFHQTTGLLEASRLSVFAPSIFNDNTIDYELLFKLYNRQSPGSILHSLGQDPEDYSDLLVKYGLQEDELFDSVAKGSQLASLLSDPQYIEKVHTSLSEQRKALRRYLKQHFKDQQKIGFVEIGWRGTIQNSIARLFPEREFCGLYLGLALERITMGPNSRRLAYGPDHNLGTEYIDLLDAINVLEFVCLSGGGSAESYQTQPDGHVTARMRHLAEEDQRIEAFSLPFQQGVLAMAVQADVELLMNEHNSGRLRTRAMESWRDLLKRPNETLVNSYFALKSNEQFGLGSISDQSVVPSLATVFLSPVSKTRRQQLIRYLTYSQWAEGMMHRKDLGPLSRFMYFVLMKLAVNYKKRLHSAKAGTGTGQNG